MEESVKPTMTEKFSTIRVTLMRAAAAGVESADNALGLLEELEQVCGAGSGSER